MRSASRYGRHDLGTNARRVRALIEEIDDLLATPVPDKKQKKPPAKPEKKPTNQAAGKGVSAKR